MSGKTPAQTQVEGDPLQAWAETHCKNNTATSAIEVPLTFNNMHTTRKTCILLLLIYEEQKRHVAQIERHNRSHFLPSHAYIQCFGEVGSIISEAGTSMNQGGN